MQHYNVQQEQRTWVLQEDGQQFIKEFSTLRSLAEEAGIAGHLIFQFIEMLAEFERNLISERTKAGLEAARARGKKGGRPATLATSKKVQLARQLYSDKTNDVKDICRTLNISKSTLYRYVGVETQPKE